MEAARSVVFDRTSYPPLILAFCSSVHRYGPLHIYPCICSVAPCLRVLWTSTHGCFSPSFPPFPSTWLSQPDAGARSLTPPPTMTPTTPEVPTTTFRSPMTRSSLGGSQAGGLHLFRSITQFVLAFLRQTCLTYVCTQILLLPLTRL